MVKYIRLATVAVMLMISGVVIYAYFVGLEREASQLVGATASKSNQILLSNPTTSGTKSPALAGRATVPPSTQELAISQMYQMGGMVRDLPKGKVVLNVPVSMVIGEFREVEARAGVGVTETQLHNAFKNGDQHFEGSALLSYKMKAILVGSSFDINDLTVPIQQVVATFPTQWRWRVNANKEGPQDLTAILYAVVSNNDKEVEVFLDTFTQRVSVEVKPATWRDIWGEVRGIINQTWAAIVAIIGLVGIGTFGGWVRTIVKRRRREERLRE